MFDDVRRITVGELRRQLEGIPDDCELTFASELEFYRLKMRGPKLLQMEFNELVWRDKDRNWHVEDPTKATPIGPGIAIMDVDLDKTVG